MTANHSNDLSTGIHKNAHEEIEALGEWITVTRKTAAERLELGKGADGREVHLELPDTARAKMEAEYVGTIVSIGDDAAVKHPKLQVGDRIVYQRCFPLNKVDDKTEIYSLIHMSWMMGRVHAKTVKPGMAPAVEKFKQD